VSGPEQASLGYLFAAVPHWLVDEAASGAVSPEDFLLLAFLYRRVDFRLLAKGEPTPRLTLRRISETLSLEVKLETLYKRLRRLEQRGYVGYVVQRLAGRPSMGRDLYVFTLRTDGRGASEGCPSSVRVSSAPSRPSSSESENGTAAPVSVPEPLAVSEFPDGAESTYLSEFQPDLSEFPQAANPHGEQVFAGSADGGCPSSLDVRERTNPACTESCKEKGVLDDPRAREDATDQDAFMAAFRQVNERHEPDASELIEPLRSDAKTGATLDFADALPDGKAEIVRALVEQLDATLVDEGGRP